MSKGCDKRLGIKLMDEVVEVMNKYSKELCPACLSQSLCLLAKEAADQAGIDMRVILKDVIDTSAEYDNRTNHIDELEQRLNELKGE